jgi:predicted dienelactone hydrolase
MKGVVAVAALAAVFMQAPPSGPFDLPAPTGPFAVGTTGWLLSDAARTESFAAGAAPREVQVLAWYPAAADGRAARAAYLRNGLEEVRAFARVLRAADTVFDSLQQVRTHAVMDAPLAPAPATFPVLVFSHGYTGIPSAYTALHEELASHGYIVISVVHPFEASAATVGGGRVATLLDQDGALLAPIRDVLEEWSAEDATMAAITRSADPAERARLMRGYLAKLPKTDAVLRRWVDDTKLVLAGLPSRPRDTTAGRLAARMDMRRLGAFGHSMGGVTAAQFCLEEARCRAALNLDGIPQYGSLIDASLARPFLMVYSARPGRLGASDLIYERAARPYYRVDVAGTRHLDFCDMAFWGGPLQNQASGSIRPERATAITRTIVREFFGEQLGGRRTALSAGIARFPEVAMQAPPRTAR